MDVWNWLVNSNWDSFAPDLLVGLATGTAVGLVLFAFQSRLEKAAEKRQLQRDWDALRPRLAPQFVRPNSTVWPPTSSFLSPIQGLDGIQELLTDKPTRIWAEKLGGTTLRDLHAMYNAYQEIEYLGNSLEVLLKVETERRLPLMTPPADFGEANIYQGFVRARALGVPETTWSKIYSEPVWLSEEILNLSEWQRLFPAYADSCRTLKEALARLTRIFALESEFRHLKRRIAKPE